MLSQRKALVIAAMAIALASGACGDEGSSAPSSSPTAAAQSSTTAAPTSTTSSPTTTTAATTTSVATTTTAAIDSVPLPVPQGPSPIIDGVLDGDEWSSAASETMSDGASIHLMSNGETLYIAVVSSEVGAVNVVIATDEDVSILHSSAALGSAVYQPGSDAWELAHGFSWCCRSASDQASRNTLFETETWEANIGYAGEPGTVEYAIALPWQGSAIATSTIREGGDKGFWPAELSADARDQLLGAPPPERQFNIEEWRRIAPG